jgi:hypothetical protein
MKYLLLALALLPMTSQADAVARNGDDSVRLSEAACTNAAVLKLLAEHEPDEVDSSMKAETRLSGVVYQACWHPMPGGAHLVYEDGDQGLMPWELFEKDEGV